MGTVSQSNWTSKKVVVKDLLSDYAGAGYTIHDHASTGQGLYMAVTTPSNVSLILCFQITKHNKEFYVKGMSEDMGPVMKDCPLRLLEYKSDYADQAWAKEWRDKVRAFHKEKARPVPDLMGKTIELYNKRFKVVGKVKRSYRILSLDNGQAFRLGATQAKQAKIVEV